MDRNGEAT